MKTKQKGKEEKEVVETADMRFKDSLPLKKFRKLKIGIAGLGAVGRQVAILLSAMGHKKMWGADPDRVELKNVGTQGWKHDEIGEYKVSAVLKYLNARDSRFEGCVGKYEEVWDRQDTDVVFCCVDTMQARDVIWAKVTQPTYVKKGKGKKVLQPLQGLWVDNRMTSGVVRMLTVPLGEKSARMYYYNSLYSDVDAFEGACTDRMTMYGACVAAGLMVSQLANWLNGVPLLRDFLLETQRMSCTELGK